MYGLKPSLDNLANAVDSYEHCRDLFKNPANWADIFRGKYKGRSIDVLPVVLDKHSPDWMLLVQDAINKNYTNEASYILEILAIVNPSKKTEIEKHIQKLRQNLDKFYHTFCEPEEKEAKQPHNYLCVRDQEELMKKCNVLGLFNIESFKITYDLYANYDT